MEEATGPTPETARKLKTDVILKMYRRGTIGKHELWAAEEIRTYWGAFMRMAFRPRVLDGTQDCRAQGRAPLMPSEMLTAREHEIAKRYREWSRKAGASKFGFSTALEAVIAVVIDNQSPRYIDRANRAENGKSALVTKHWLGEYGR